MDRKWILPDGSSLKINVDAAYLTETGAAALGVIIRDREGKAMLVTWRRLFYCRNADEAEASACLEGIRLAGRWQDRPMILESDCTAVVTYIQAGSAACSVVAPVIHEAVEECWLLRVQKIGREQNKVAHVLAHLA